MSFQEDVEVVRYELNRGIKANWESDGSDIGASATVDAVDTGTGTGGRLESLRVMGKSEDIGVYVDMDGQTINWSHECKMEYLMETYGCCGLGSLFELVKYDTVNDKYILQLTRPVEFGDRLKIRLKNYSASAQKAHLDCVYIKNS